MSSPDPSASPAPGPVQLARSLRLLRSDASSSVRFLRVEFGGLTGNLAAFRPLGTLTIPSSLNSNYDDVLATVDRATDKLVVNRHEVVGVRDTILKSVAHRAHGGGEASDVADDWAEDLASLFPAGPPPPPGGGDGGSDVAGTFGDLVDADDDDDADDDVPAVFTSLKHSVEGSSLRVVAEAAASQSVSLLLAVQGSTLGRISAPPPTGAAAGNDESKASDSMAPPPISYLTLWGSAGGSFAAAADAALLKALNACAESNGWTIGDFLRQPMSGVGGAEQALSELVRSVSGQAAAQRRASLAKQEVAARSAGSHSRTFANVVGHMFGAASLCPTPGDLDQSHARVHGTGTPFLIFVHSFTAVLGSVGADVLAQAAIDHYCEEGASASVDITSAKIIETSNDRSGRGTLSFTVSTDLSKNTAVALVSACRDSARRVPAALELGIGKTALVSVVSASRDDVPGSGYSLRYELKTGVTVASALVYFRSQLVGYWVYRVGGTDTLDMALPIDTTGAKYIFLSLFSYTDWCDAAGMSRTPTAGFAAIFSSISSDPVGLDPVADQSGNYWEDKLLMLSGKPHRGPHTVRILNMARSYSDKEFAGYIGWVDDFQAGKLPEQTSMECGFPDEVTAADDVPSLSDRMSHETYGPNQSYGCLEIRFVSSRTVYLLSEVVHAHTIQAATRGEPTRINPARSGDRGRSRRRRQATKQQISKLEVVELLSPGDTSSLDSHFCRSCGRGGHSKEECKSSAICLAKCFQTLVDGKCPGECKWPVKGTDEYKLRWTLARLQARDRLALTYMAHLSSSRLDEIPFVPFAADHSMQIGIADVTIVGGFQEPIQQDVSPVARAMLMRQAKAKAQLLTSTALEESMVMQGYLENTGLDFDDDSRYGQMQLMLLAKTAGQAGHVAIESVIEDTRKSLLSSRLNTPGRARLGDGAPSTPVNGYAPMMIERLPSPATPTDLGASASGTPRKAARLSRLTTPGGGTSQ